MRMSNTPIKSNITALLELAFPLNIRDNTIREAKIK